MKFYSATAYRGYSYSKIEKKDLETILLVFVVLGKANNMIELVARNPPII